VFARATRCASGLQCLRKLAPVSLKDQMIRAWLFVDCAVENNEISAAPIEACWQAAALRAASAQESWRTSLSLGRRQDCSRPGLTSSERDVSAADAMPASACLMISTSSGLAPFVQAA